MKRFTETNKWRDPWFRRLSSTSKLLWTYLTDNCDQIGLVEVDFGLMTADLGAKVSESNLSEFNGRIQKISDGKYFLPKFITFQYGELSDKCPPHKTVLRLIEIHKLKKDGLHYVHPTGDAIKVDPPKEPEHKSEPELVLLKPAVTSIEIYDAYPRKLARRDALVAIEKAMKKMDPEKLLEVTKKYAASTIGKELRFVPYPASWFNAEHFFDDPAMWNITNNETNKPNPRNIGIAKTGPSYGDLARAKLERQRMVSQVDQAGHPELAGVGTP